jgi:hypothetical protein
LEREAAMRKYLAAAVLAIGVFWAVTGTPSPQDLFEGIVGKQKAVDADHLLTKQFVIPPLQANCDISAALQAALTGDDKVFGLALERSEENLRGVAKGLPPLAAKRLYRKSVKIPIGIVLEDEKARSSPTGDDVLREIARLAGQSADALDTIRNGKGGEDDLATVIKNNGIISQLIFAFYTAVSS